MLAVNYSEGKVRTIDAPEPSGEGVLVNISTCGICGTDMHLLESGMHIPHIAGHEISGYLSDGSPVVIEPLTYCGSCQECKEGKYNLCSSKEFNILGATTDGGMTEKMIVPEHCIVKLNKNINVKDSSLVEPIAVAVHGYKITKTNSKDTIAVVGGGSIGQCAVIAGYSMGCKVDLYARYEHQKEAAEIWGAKDPEGEYDVVVDTVGNSESLSKCVELLKPGGKIIELAAGWEDIHLPGLGILNKEGSFYTSRIYDQSGDNGRDIDVAAKILFENPEFGSKVITHRFPLEASEEAFRVAGDRKSGAIKVIFDVKE
jgi:threonine dehydrogenase-like Zn-dependent dehydrogenase